MEIDFDAQTKETLAKLVTTHFPDASLDEGSLLGLASALFVSDASEHCDLSPYRAELERYAEKLGLELIPGDEDGAIQAAPSPDDAGARYYHVYAKHHRKIPELEAFTGYLQLARVRLPDDTPATFQTRLGTIEPRDHLLKTVADCQAKYGSELSYPVARLDVVTPARLGGARFGAVSAYLGYQDADGDPTFYVLEAGTAMGDPKVLYFEEVGEDFINSYSGYRPTPFANPRHAYVGRLRLEGDRPSNLRLNVRRLDDPKPYMKLDVNFEEVTNPQVIWPGFHILRALGIVVSRLAKVPQG